MLTRRLFWRNFIGLKHPLEEQDCKRRHSYRACTIEALYIFNYAIADSPSPRQQPWTVYTIFLLYRWLDGQKVIQELHALHERVYNYFSYWWWWWWWWWWCGNGSGEIIIVLSTTRWMHHKIKICHMKKPLLKKSITIFRTDGVGGGGLWRILLACQHPP